MAQGLSFIAAYNLLRGHVCNEARLDAFGPELHHRLVHSRLRTQSVLNLAELDTLAAQLDLEIHSATKLKFAIGAPASSISGAIDDPAPGGICMSPRVDDESLGGELGLVEVASRHLHAPQPELTVHADGHEAACLEINDEARDIG